MNDNKNDDSDQRVELIKKRLEEDGMVVAHVVDGYVCLFKRQFLLDMIAKHPNQEQIAVFVKDSSKIN